MEEKIVVNPAMPWNAYERMRDRIAELELALRAVAGHPTVSEDIYEICRIALAK